MRVLPERCTGCGECIVVCPQDAIFMQNGCAIITNARCTECMSCQQVCPSNAIQESEIAPVVSGEVVELQSTVISQPQRSPLLPMISAAILWIGREIFPRMATLALDMLEYRLQEKALSEAPARNGRFCRLRGWHQRQRQRQRQFGGFYNNQKDNDREWR